MLPIDPDNYNNKEDSLDTAEKEKQVKAFACSIIENQVMICH